MVYSVAIFWWAGLPHLALGIVVVGRIRRWRYGLWRKIGAPG